MKSVAVLKIRQFREQSQAKSGRTEVLLSYFTDKELNNREIKVRQGGCGRSGNQSQHTSLITKPFFILKDFIVYSSDTFYGAEREAELASSFRSRVRITLLFDLKTTSRTGSLLKSLSSQKCSSYQLLVIWRHRDFGSVQLNSGHSSFYTSNSN